MLLLFLFAEISAITHGVQPIVTMPVTDDRQTGASTSVYGDRIVGMLTRHYLSFGQKGINNDSMCSGMEVIFFSFCSVSF